MREKRDMIPPAPLSRSKGDKESPDINFNNITIYMPWIFVCAGHSKKKLKKGGEKEKIPT